jgi:EmrB/QacA subfamily drug resistance transporter
MEGLDSSVVNTALPAIARDLGTTIPQLAAAVTSYLISLAVFMPLGGWLADRFGGRQVFMSALAIFATGSLLCGLAPNSITLIIGRIVQGMGGAMMVPVGRAILMSSVPKSDYLRAMSYVIVPALIGPAAGPLVGGFLSTYVSWHWIFLINLPLAVLGIFMSLRFMPSGVAEGDGNPKPLDWIGYGCLIVALGVGQGAIEMLGHGASHSLTFAAVLLSALGGYLFYWRYRQIGSGILDLSLLRIRTLRLSISAGSIVRIGLGGIPLLLPLLLQLGFGYNPFQSGLVTCLIAIGSAIVKPIMSFSLRLLGCRRLILANSVLLALGLLGFLMFREASLLWLMSPYVFVFGLFRSVQMSTMNALSYTDVEKPEMARASTMSTLAQRLSMGVGVNIAASVLTIASQGERPDLNAFAIAFAATAALVLIGGVMFLKLQPSDGWQVSNRPAPDTQNATFGM